ncbi:hypothetical protein MTO96_005573 [Rhipicephalus appendiculatus]
MSFQAKKKKSLAAFGSGWATSDDKRKHFAAAKRPLPMTARRTNRAARGRLIVNDQENSVAAIVPPLYVMAACSLFATASRLALLVSSIVPCSVRECVVRVRDKADV